MTEKNKQTAFSFEDIYVRYYPKLVRFSKEYVLSQPDAENIVQDCFMFLWENKQSIPSINNINAFLFRLVKNKCVDFLRHKITAEEKRETIQTAFIAEYRFKLQSIESFDSNALSDEDIEKIISDAINRLPAKCREIFILSRLEGMTYENIALQLNLSPHTVRNQISLALKKMKHELKDYLPLLLFLIS